MPDANDWLQAMKAEGVPHEEQVKLVRQALDKAPTLLEAMARRTGETNGAGRLDALKAFYELAVTVGDVERGLQRTELAKLLKVGVRDFDNAVKETEKALEERGQQTKQETVKEIVGGYVKGWLIDLCYDPAEERTFFAYRNPEGMVGESGMLELEGVRYTPKAPDDLIVRGAVVLPSGLGEETAEADLVAMLRDFIHRYFLIDRFYEDICAHWAMYSWKYDAFRDAIYLRALGEFGAAKTRLMTVIGYVSYRLMLVSGAASDAALYRTIEDYRGTVFIDEADKQYSDPSSVWVKIMNQGSQRGFPVIKMRDAGGGKFVQEAFDVYSPKLITTRERFEDDALESRCLTIEMMQHGTKELVDRDIRLHLPKSFFEEAAELRNRLLRWRLETWRPEIELGNELVDVNIQPRLNQVVMPLKAIVQDEKVLEELTTLVRGYHQRMVTEKSMTLEAKVLQALVEIQEGEPMKVNGDVYWDLSLKHVAEVANQIINRENAPEGEEDEDEEEVSMQNRGKKLTPRGAGALVAKLGLNKERQSGGPLKGLITVIWDDERILGLRERYGV